VHVIAGIEKAGRVTIHLEEQNTWTDNSCWSRQKHQHNSLLFISVSST